MDMQAWDKLVAIIGITVACICFVSVHKSFRKGIPVSWPVIGMVPSLFLNLHHLYDWLAQALDQCGGTFAFKGPSEATSAVLTSDPANVEFIIKTNFSSFPKGPTFRRACGDLLGHGIFNADGELWEQQRRATVAKFNSASSLTYVMESLHEMVLRRLVPLLEVACSKHKVVDLQEVFTRFTFDNICRIAFGVETGCLSADLPVVPFAKAFEVATEMTMLKFVTPRFVRKVMRRWGFGLDLKLQGALKIVDDFIVEIVSSRIKRVAGGGRRDDLLSTFVKSNDNNGLLYSSTFLRDVCVNFILAGRDTSSVALSWFFWLLFQHPHVEGNILHEIKAIIKARSDYGNPINPVYFTKEELKQMHYLHASLTETMRLYPPVPVERKQATDDVILPDGTPVKKGTVIFYVIYAMGRMKSIWGEDCREFRPERWLQNGVFVSQPAHKYTVFNGGLRLCLGKDFAYMQMKYIAAVLLYRFKITPAADVKRIGYRLGLTLYMKGSLPVTLHERQMNNMEGLTLEI